jgi:Flp pilus assembly protein TadD
VQYSEAIRFKPGFVLAHLGLGMMLAQQNQLPAAEAQFAKAVELEPRNVGAHFNLAAAFEAEGDLDKAAAEFSQTIRLKTNNFDALRRFASILARQQQFEPAMNAFRDALKVKPDSPETLSNLAWLLATCPKAELRNGQEAVRLAERAHDLGDPHDARFLSVLDAAYAEAGRFDEAIKTAQQVQDLATSAKQTALAEGAAKRLELYRAGKAFHQ